MNSRLFKRAHQAEDLVTRNHVKQANEAITGILIYFDKMGGSFDKLRWASEAKRTITSFLSKNSDLVPQSVIRTVSEINQISSRLAAADFDYDKFLDEEDPNEMFDAPPESDQDVISELGNVVGKTASDLLGDGQSEGKWDNFSSEGLSKMVKALSSSNDFDTDKEAQTAVSEMSEVLSKRSPEQPVEPKQASKDDLKVTDNSGNLDGDSIDDRLKGEALPKIADQPTNAEVLEGDKSVTAKKKQSNIFGLRLANIE